MNKIKSLFMFSFLAIGLLSVMPNANCAVAVPPVMGDPAPELASKRFTLGLVKTTLAVDALAYLAYGIYRSQMDVSFSVEDDLVVLGSVAKNLAIVANPVSTQEGRAEALKYLNGHKMATAFFVGNFASALTAGCASLKWAYDARKLRKEQERLELERLERERLEEEKEREKERLEQERIAFKKKIFGFTSSDIPFIQKEDLEDPITYIRLDGSVNSDDEDSVVDTVRSAIFPANVIRSKDGKFFDIANVAMHIQREGLSKGTLNFGPDRYVFYDTPEEGARLAEYIDRIFYENRFETEDFPAGNSDNFRAWFSKLNDPDVADRIVEAHEKSNLLEVMYRLTDGVMAGDSADNNTDSAARRERDYNLFLKLKNDLPDDMWKRIFLCDDVENLRLEAGGTTCIYALFSLARKRISDFAVLNGVKIENTNRDMWLPFSNGVMRDHGAAVTVEVFVEGVRTEEVFVPFRGTEEETRLKEEQMAPILKYLRKLT